MKKFYLFLFFQFLVVSCFAQNNNMVFVRMPEANVMLASGLTSVTYKKLENEMEVIVNNQASLNNEQLCYEKVVPFINDGRKIQQEILTGLLCKGMKNDPLYTFYEKLSEQELASLSFIVYNVNKIKEIVSNSDVNSLAWGKVKDCLGFALGLSSIKDLSLKGVLTATTLRSTIIAIGKRYLGYIGVVLMISDFYDCFYNSMPNLGVKPGSSNPNSDSSNVILLPPTQITGNVPTISTPNSGCGPISGWGTIGE